MQEQFLLGQQRQRTLDGREEPLVEQLVADAPIEAAEPDTATLPLPFTRKAVQLQLHCPRDATGRLVTALKKLAAAVVAARSAAGQSLILKRGATNSDLAAHLRRVGKSVELAPAEGWGPATPPPASGTKEGRLARAKKAARERRVGVPRAVSKCEPVEVHARCSRGCNHKTIHGCTLSRCVNGCCRAKRREERKRRRDPAWEAFDRDGKITPIGCFVLAFCPAAREVLHDPEVWRRALRVCDALVEAWWLGVQGLKQNGWRLGIAAVTHPEGDRDKSEWGDDDDAPDFVRGKQGAWLPHWNGLMPMIAIRSGMRPRVLRYSIPKPEFIEAKERLCELWAVVQGILSGRPLKTRADAWYGFATTKEKRHHRGRYFFRTFPAWDARSQRVRTAGFLAPNSKLRPAELIALEKKAEEELANLADQRSCPTPKCGGEIWFDTTSIPGNYFRVDQYLAADERRRAARAARKKAAGTGPPDG